MTNPNRFALSVLLCSAFAAVVVAQTPPPAQQPPTRPEPPAWAANLAVEEKATARFDADKSGWLNLAERRTARETLAREAAARPPLGMPAQPTTGIEPTKPGPRVSVSDAR